MSGHRAQLPTAGGRQVLSDHPRLYWTRHSTPAGTGWFLTFIFTHAFFVFTTGLLVSLNHIHAGRDDESSIGLAPFAASTVVVIAGWVAATPSTIRHPI